MGADDWGGWFVVGEIWVRMKWLRGAQDGLT